MITKKRLITAAGSLGMAVALLCNTFAMTRPCFGGDLELLSPRTGSTDVSTNDIVFSWTSVADATSYTFVLSPNADLTEALVSQESSLTDYNFAGPLEYLKTYYWQVESWQDGILLTMSDVGVFTTVAQPVLPTVGEIVQPASAPLIISPEIGSTDIPITDIVFSWTGVPEVTSYTFILSPNADMTEALVSQETYFTDYNFTDPLEYLKTYYWQVEAWQDGILLSMSDVGVFTTLAEPAIAPIDLDRAPSPPVVISPEIGSIDVPVDSVVLSWTSVTGASSYTFILSSNADLTDPIVTKEITDASYKLVGPLEYLATYYWQIEAWQDGILLSMSDIGVFTTLAEPVPSPSGGLVTMAPSPVIIYPEIGGTDLPINDIHFSWTNIPGATSYSFILSLNANLMDYLTRQEICEGGYNLAGPLEYNQTYYWQVKVWKSGTPLNTSDVGVFTTMAEPVPLPQAVTEATKSPDAQSLTSLKMGITESGINNDELEATEDCFSDTETTPYNTFTAWISAKWTQTTQTDFANGVLQNVDITTSPGNVILAKTTGAVSDYYDNISKIASISNLAVVGGIVQLSSSTPPVVRTEFPNANDKVNLAPFPTSTQNWDDVNDVTADGDATYVYGQTAGTWIRDLYRFANLGNTGAVANVTLHFVARSTASSPTAYARPVMYTSSGGATIGPQVALTNTWTEYVAIFPFAPGTTTPWTVGTLNGASMGIELESATGNQARCTQIWVQVNYSGAYFTSGTLTSVNLLNGICNTSINSFTYNALTIPTGTTMTVQFSQDNTTWFSSTNVLGGSDTMMTGTNTISLSALNWSGQFFYYRLTLTTNNTVYTPVLDYITVNYSYYFASGTIASQVFDTTITGASWDALIADLTLISGTNITFEVRASDTPFLKDANTPSWISVGSSPVLSGLPAGRYKQWRATLTTICGAWTPILSEVRLFYDP